MVAKLREKSQLKQSQPTKPPIELLIISSGVGLLPGTKTCNNSTIVDKLALANITVKISSLNCVLYFCKRLVQKKPIGINNKILLTVSWKEVVLLKLLTISSKEKESGNEKLKG